MDIFISKLSYPITGLRLLQYLCPSAGLHNIRPAKPFIAALENFNFEMQKAVHKLLQVLERRKLQDFTYCGKTNVQLIWEHLYTVCEQTFSRMNFNKNKQRSPLTDEHLENILKISSSSVETDYVELVANKRCNISH